ncbi:MAG: hypothetical protein IJ261_03085 [Clostridia bacterium]|nr:hypothetical protein [Clostridia bacterium]
MIRQLSAIASLMIAGIAAFFIITAPIKTDMSAYSGILLPDILKECLPERDLIGYGAFVVIFPVMYIAFMHLLRKLIGTKASKYVSAAAAADVIWSVCVALASIAFLALFYLHPYYADRYLYGKSKLPIAIICMIFLFVMSYAFQCGRLKTANEVAAVVVSVAFLLFVLYAVGKYNYMLTYSSYNFHHFSAWWNPIYKVGSGMTLGCGFNELYGFYPYLVVPVLKLFGGVNQESLSLYMSIVFVVMAICILVFCNRFFKNKLLGALCAVGFFALGPMSYFGNTEVYFQYYPTRALFVFLVLGLITLYCSVKKCHRLIMAGGMLLCALAIMWNTESGLVATIVWAGFLIFDKALYCRLNDKALIKRIIFAVVSSVASVVLFVLIVEAVTYFRAGILLGKEDILFGILTFSGVGFYMLPLKPGMWFAVVFALFYGLYVSVPHLAFARKKGEEFSGDKDNITAVFMASVAGIGSFMYFMGRSYPTNCMTFLPWVVMMCALFADKNIVELGDLIKEHKTKLPFFKSVSVILRNVVCFAVLGVSLCASFMMVSNAFNAESKINSRFNSEQTAFVTLADQIENWAQEECDGETPYIFHTYAAFIQELMDVPARENVYEQINWFYYSDVHTYIEFIEAHPNKPFVIDEEGAYSLKSYFPEEWAEIESEYELRDTIVWDMYDAEDKINNVYLYMPCSSDAS